MTPTTPTDAQMKLADVTDEDREAAHEFHREMFRRLMDPFEKALGKRQLLCKDDESVTWSAITVGDLRKARQALATWRRT